MTRPAGVPWNEEGSDPIADLNVWNDMLNQSGLGVEHGSGERFVIDQKRAVTAWPPFVWTVWTTTVDEPSGEERCHLQFGVSWTRRRGMSAALRAGRRETSRLNTRRLFGYPAELSPQELAIHEARAFVGDRLLAVASFGDRLKRGRMT